jgi:hypothetical protein
MAIMKKLRRIREKWNSIHGAIMELSEKFLMADLQDFFMW